MVVLVTISSKLIFFNTKNNFIEKESVHILFDVNYFRLIWLLKHQIDNTIFEDVSN